MAKTLSFTDTSPQTVKIGDTTTSFTLICGNDNVATDLTSATSITVKLGNTSGYLKSATVDPASLTDPTTGQVTVTFTADLMTGLTAGSYVLEVWVVDSTGTSIYPSDGSTGFNITNNIQSTNGSTLTTITFDDFVKELKEVASTIKGEKGDTGTVDNAGLTTAPAFVELQTQVDNSAVGTNLLINTSGSATKGQTTFPGGAPTILGTYSRTDSYEQVTPPSSGEYFYRFTNPVSDNLCGLVAGETYTIQGEVYVNKGDVRFRSEFQSSGSWNDYPGNVSDNLASNTSGFTKVAYTFTVPSNATAFFPSWQVYNFDSTTIFRFKNTKLEKGSVATDWCPNPTEILTQADYAKIQAAIVALGGSLS